MLEAKLKQPGVRPGAVARPRLVKSLRRGDETRVATIIAPAGYGKTALLAEWAAAETRPVAWVSIDDRDNDPVRLLRHIVVAVDRVEPLDRRLFTLLRAPTRSTWRSTADRTVRTVAACIRPYVLMLDNVDLLRSREPQRVLSALVDRIPPGSTMVLAARVMPKLRVAALREHGALKEVGVPDLALTTREAQLLLRAADADLDEAETEELIERSEGWPAALYLAALSLRDGTPAAVRPAHFAGDDRYLVDYLRMEYVSHLRQRELRFLRRTSILGALAGPLCDAVLQDEGSARELKKIARANLFLVPLERRGWYRFHQLFRDLLLGELAKTEPQLIPTLHRRAAEWFEAKGDLETALEHADAAGDGDRVAAIVCAIAFPVSCRGRAAMLERWLGRFAVTGLERYPLLAVHGSRLHALRGRTTDAERWLEAAERAVRSRRRNAAAVRPLIAVVRAALCREGPRQMLLDANAALRKLPRGSEWRPAALLMRGTAAMLLGAPESAEAALDDAGAEASALGWSETRMIAVALQSLIASAREDLDRADELAQQARAIGMDAELEGYPTYALALALCAHSSLRHGRWAEARELLAAADRSRTSLTAAVPWLAVTVRLELARCYVTLRDVDEARALIAEIAAILELRRDLGALVERRDQLARDVRALSLVEENARLGLTPAELRLLPLLATHLSFREIAEQLKVSRNTVKTQAISIYRKLGVSGRSEAIAEAARLDPTRVAA